MGLGIKNGYREWVLNFTVSSIKLNSFSLLNKNHLVCLSYVWVFNLN